MATISITQRTLTAKISEAGKSKRSFFLWDTDLKGFGVRIAASGRTTWLAQKAIGRGAGSTQRIVVGHYPAMPLDEARLKAGQTISRLASGENIVSVHAAKRAAKRERLQCPTISEASTRYLGEWSAKSRRSHSGNYERYVRLCFNNVIIPDLGASTRVNDITKAHIRGVLNKRKDAGRFQAARSIFAQLRPFFDWCVHEEYIGISPCQGVVPPDASKERQHKLTQEEIIAFWQSATPETNMLGDWCRVLLLTKAYGGRLDAMARGKP
jgi:hypothetical protein